MTFRKNISEKDLQVSRCDWAADKNKGPLLRGEYRVETFNRNIGGSYMEVRARCPGCNMPLFCFFYDRKHGTDKEVATCKRCDFVLDKDAMLDLETAIRSCDINDGEKFDLDYDKEKYGFKKLKKEMNIARREKMGATSPRFWDDFSPGEFMVIGFNPLIVALKCTCSKNNCHMPRALVHEEILHEPVSDAFFPECSFCELRYTWSPYVDELEEAIKEFQYWTFKKHRYRDIDFFG